MCTVNGREKKQADSEIRQTIPSFSLKSTNKVRGRTFIRTLFNFRAIFIFIIVCRGFLFNFRAFSIDAEFFFCQFPTSFTVCLAYITEQLFFAMINVEILPTHRIIEI